MTAEKLCEHEKPAGRCDRYTCEHSSASARRYRERSSRKYERRAEVINLQRISKRALRVLRAENVTETYWRPSTRGECAAVERPCPYVACAYHLYLDATPAGNIKLNFPELEPDELVETCALDVADEGGMALEDVGALLNITRERVRQVEVEALSKLQRMQGPFADHLDEERVPVRAHQFTDDEENER